MATTERVGGRSCLWRLSKRCNVVAVVELRNIASSSPHLTLVASSTRMSAVFAALCRTFSLPHHQSVHVGYSFSFHFEWADPPLWIRPHLYRNVPSLRSEVPEPQGPVRLYRLIWLVSLAINCRFGR